MVNPIYSDSFYRMNEVIGPHSIKIRIEILDFKRLIEKLLNVKGGGFITLEKRDSNREISIILDNTDSGSTKTLGG